MKLLTGIKKQLYLNFKKSEILEIIIIDELKRVNKYIYKTDIKDGKTFSINDKTYIINNDSVVYKNGYPSLIYKYNSYNPLSTITDQTTDLTPSELNTMLDNKIVSEMFKASETDDKQNLVLIGVIVAIVVSIFSVYMTYNIDTTLNNIQNEIVQETTNNNNNNSDTRG